MKNEGTEKIQVYVTKTQAEKIDKNWRNLGYFSASDYGRDLFRIDLKKTGI